MKLSDYVADFLASKGIKHVFAISGGASVHLIQSLADTQGITFICPQHEQAGAMAADAYSRVTGNLGAAISTSGPGATNLITGICCAYYDSIPVIFITGQVATFRLRGDTGVRQMGFQETDMVDTCKSITKYVMQINDPNKIKYELEKACYLAVSGRPGPVLLDIPDDIQREQIDPDKLESFIPKQKNKDINISILIGQVDECIELINNAKRPVIILGWGIRLAKVDEEVRNLINCLNFPVVPTWAVADILPFDNPLLVGTFGTHGTRYANFTVQNADLVLSIGSRLDTKATGSPMTTFAREAKKIVVDIDPSELDKFNKFGMNVDLLICADAKDFIFALNHRVGEIEKQDISDWIGQISEWKRKYPICPHEYYKEKEVNPYVFMKILSKESKEGDIFISDTGCALAWMMQSFDFKRGQRIYHDWNNTAMGWALPASIGASFAFEGNKRIICVVGDGSLQMNIQELATVVRHQLPIKIFLINNHGYSMIQQTQDQWLESCYLASTVEGGLAFPEFEKVANAYGFKTVRISSNDGLQERIREVLDSEEYAFCNVEIGPDYKVIPQVIFGRPNEDAEPLLDRKEFLENMIVNPVEESLK